ncbi:uncharacterized protein LOC106152839 [Lingula anatina]|uniref:Uncharacterized protein LOC106152839 n=1 Tax=Lingula anatina TaxID=7574 RepID=A0A1S3H7D4_LINAN|nr:uncharacterized protein LOC106152839 [Lingula anatina]|eukprot:XP_013382030.1 uncharacterized protein LOC106152839 [Lingula anatina]
MDNSFLPVEHSISDNNVTESDDELDLEELQQLLYGDTCRVSQPIEEVGSDFDADTQGKSTRSGGGEINRNLALGTSSRLNQATRGKHGAKNVESTQSTPSPIYEVNYRIAIRYRADGGIEDSKNWMKLCQAKFQKFNEMSYKQRKDRERDYEPKVQVIVKNGAGQVMASVLCGQFQTYEELALQIGNKVFSENSAYVYPDFTLAFYHENEIHLMGHDECIGNRADSIGGPLVLYVVPTMDIPEQWTWRLSCT